MSARVKLPDPLDKLLRSQLEEAIHEAALHRDDELIARRYLIDKWCQMDIAAELGWRRATVGDHLKHILERVKNVSAKLYFWAILDLSVVEKVVEIFIFHRWLW